MSRVRKVTLQDVAARAGVSMKTVSNVVRGYQHVSPAMRARVQAAVDELGYRPDSRGRSLATGRSSMLALAFPDLRRPYFAELAHVFARVSAARGYRLLLEETGGTAEGERSAIEDREAGIVDGVVMHPQVLTATELDALRGDTPMVFLGEDPQPPGTPSRTWPPSAAGGSGSWGTRPATGPAPPRSGSTGSAAGSRTPGCRTTTACWSPAASATRSAPSRPSGPRSTPACASTRCCAATTWRPSAPCAPCGCAGSTCPATSRWSAGTPRS